MVGKSDIKLLNYATKAVTSFAKEFPDGPDEYTLETLAILASTVTGKIAQITNVPHSEVMHTFQILLKQYNMVMLQREEH